MPIITQCDSCGKKYRIPDHQAGSFLPCKNCGEDMYVDDAGVAGSAPLSRGRSTGRISAPQGGGMPGWAIGAIAGGVGLVVLVVILLSVGGKSGGSSDQPESQVTQENPSTPPVAPQTPGFPAGASRNPTSPNRTTPNRSTTNNENPFKAANGSASLTKVTDWLVTVDPAPPELLADATSQAAMIDQRLGGTFNKEVLTPKSYSPFIVTRTFPSGGYIYDLRTGDQRILTDSAFRLTDTVAFSPGGGHFAVKGLSSKSELKFFDIDETQVTGSVPLGKIEELMFLSERHLLALTETDLILFDVQSHAQSGTLENAFASDKFSQGKVTALSPGGRILVHCPRTTISDKTIRLEFFDLQQMQPAGQFDLEKKDESFEHAMAVDFSLDGRYLAILTEGNQTMRLSVLDIASGKVVQDLALKDDFEQLQDLEFYAPSDHKKMVWFPDGQRVLLLARGVFDVQEGRLIHVLPEADPGNTCFYQPVSSTQIVGITGETFSPSLTTINLPIDAVGENSAVAGNPAGGPNPFQKVTAADGTKNPFKAANGGLKRVAGWSVNVDPPPESLAYDTSEKVKRLRVKLGDGYNDNIVTPTSFSPFVAVPSRTGYDVYDLRTGSVRARTKVEFGNFAKAALSPEAGYFATTLGTFGKDGFGIYDIKAKKDLGSVPVTDVKDIMFASDQKLIIATDSELGLYEVQTGVKQDSLSISSGRSNKLALSPGGRYLADLYISSGINDDVSLAIYDLERMTKAGQINFKKGEGGIFVESRGVAFSPDGEQLAAVTTDNKQARMLIWDVASGQKLDDFEIKNEFDRLKESNRSIAWNGKNDLAWFPDKNRLLLMDYGIVDRHVGELVFILPSQNGSSSFRWPASETQLVGIVGAARSPSLVSIDLPVELFDQAREAIAKGGLAIDAILPPITNIKTDQLLPPQLPQGGWKVTADPAPQPMEKLIPKTLEFKLPRDEGYFSQFFLSDASAGRAVIARKTSANRWRHNGEPIVFQAWLDIYDLSRGKQLGELELPYPADAIAFSPSGKYVVTRDAEDQERIDIWNPDEEKHVLGFRPHFDLRESGSGRTGRSDYWEMIRLDLSIKAARFLDDEHMVTLSGEDRLRGWKLPECSLLYELHDIGVPGISPGGRLLAAHDKDSVMIHDAHTGKILGQLNAPGKMTSAAFHPNGRLLAVTVSRDADYFLYLWDLETGKEISSFPLPTAANSIRFAHENYVLINDRNLVDLKRKAVAWNYLFPEPCFLPFGIDDRTLFCGPLPDRRPILYLTAVNLPSDTLLQKIENSSLSAEFIPLAGKSFSLSAMIQGEAELEKNAVERFTGRLESMGCPVKPDGRFELAMRTEEKQGRTATFIKTSDPFSGGLLGPSLFSEPDPSNIQSANIRNVECSLTMYDSRQQVWRTASTFSNYSSGVTVREGSSLQGELDKNLTRGIGAFFSSTPIPTFVFPPGAEAGLGRSQLDQYGTISD